jgi:hypothetical protein
MAAVLDRVRDLESAVPDFEEHRARVLQKLIDAVRSFAGNTDDDSAFCSLIKHAQSVLEIEDDELGSMLKVSRTTIGRWARGVTAPHALMQESVLRSIARIAESKLRHRRLF